MTLYFYKLISATALALLLARPGLATAEDYYRPTKGYRAEPVSDPPPYVRNLSRTRFEQFRDVEWLDIGLDFRSRYEYRENDYRPTPTGSNSSTVFRPEPDNLWLLRTRAYLGVKDILDPLRFAVELQDSRSYNGLYERNVSDVNEFELIQGYAELYFKNLLGHNRPLSIRAGRMHLDLLDRRLIANNQFRNTTNNFEGFRIRFGKRQNNWDLDTFAFQPVERLKYNFDRPDEDTWVYGGVLSLKQWSEFITIQPYFLGRKQNGDPYNKIIANRKNDMDIYAPGLRVYGFFGSGFDFDADINKQFGRFGVTRTVNGQNKQFLLHHNALAYSLELGRTFDHDWKPRASLYYGYGTGDKDPNRNASSGSNERFDAFYGFNQPWSRNDYFSWDNIHAPKARLEFTPYKNIRIDTGYNAYWLQSETDAWNRANLRDLTGQSGSFLGHEFDIRLRHTLNPFVDWSLSYARFTPGDFTKAQAKATTGPFTTEPSNFFYFEVNLNAFGDGKPI
ncbi:Alginate export protein [Candidatus Methylobacter favarea]|uniref:Alginate export protein n=1 Tax=Candidatus Methylobacter favarea TaxID=2707345 RepID=A0A8S0XET9_9GAMM|nr:alginate export family protein [Candidatus Methylobacter favarea]CAA9890064.1 Alginate export protein [Candidatus Methylobacter favarea]